MKQQSFEDTREYKNWKVVVFSIIFFLILWVWFLVYYFVFNWKSKQPIIDNTPPVEQQQKNEYLDMNMVQVGGLLRDLNIKTLQKQLKQKEMNWWQN